MKKITFLLLVILSACFDPSPDESKKVIEADCDDKDKAQKTLEEIKTNEFSLLKKTDAGCTTEP